MTKINTENNVIVKLPRKLDKLTPEWLTVALGERCPGVKVVSAAIEKVIWGTATKVLMNVEYAGSFAGNGPPQKICIKGEFDEILRDTLVGVTTTGTQIEAEFFNDLAPTLGIPLLHHWYAGSEPGMGILILDNLSARNARFGTPTEPWTPDLVSKGLDVLAKLHASTWDRTFKKVPWLQVGSPMVRQYQKFLMSENHWQEHFANPEVFQLPEPLKNRERLLHGLSVLYDYDDAHANSLIHGDAHLGNTCVDADGQPFFIDWAGPCLSCWAFDVSYFVAGALTVADRRATESDLFRHYLDKLVAFGAPTLDIDEAWQDYRRHHMHGMGWVALPPLMQSLENVHAMGERFAAAMIDHDTLRLLGV